MKTTTLYKFPAESRAYAVDFAEQPEIVAGATLTGTPVVTPTLVSGGGTLTVGAPSISGTKVQFNLSGGTLGAVWKLIVTVSTNGSATLAGKVTLNIAEEP